MGGRGLSPGSPENPETRDHDPSFSTREKGQLHLLPHGCARLPRDALRGAPEGLPEGTLGRQSSHRHLACKFSARPTPRKPHKCPSRDTSGLTTAGPERTKQAISGKIALSPDTSSLGVPLARKDEKAGRDPASKEGSQKREKETGTTPPPRRLLDSSGSSRAERSSDCLRLFFMAKHNSSRA